MSRLKINFEKSEVLLVQPDEEKLIFYADLFNCQTGTWPIKYLGISVCHRRTIVAEMKFVGERIRKGTEGWIGGALSIGGRVTKIDACLSNSPVYQMSLRLLHKTNLEELEKPIRAFFWASSRNKKKVYWVSWKRICKPKCKGGLGIKNLTKFNISLICKWWWKLEEGVGPWQDFMWKKYLRNSGIYTVIHKQKDSALWSDMLHVKDLYLYGRKMQVGDGTRTHFWGDSWCGHSPLKDKFPDLFAICNDQNITVANAARTNWRLSFKRWLSVDLQKIK
jgi:hypothetical protein